MIRVSLRLKAVIEWQYTPLLKYEACQAAGMTQPVATWTCSHRPAMRRLATGVTTLSKI
jgi:hypothetical protein